METASKFTLNPLATCFIPSSMKCQRMTSVVFSVPCNKTVIRPRYAKRHFQTFSKKLNTVDDYVPVIKVQSDPVKKILEEPFVIIEEIKETKSDTTRDCVEYKPLTTKQTLSTVNEMSEGTAARSINGRYSKNISNEGIGLKDTRLTELDISLPSKTVTSKISELLKGETKSLWMLLPSAIQSLLLIEFIYRVGLRTINLNFNLILIPQSYSIFKPNFKTVTYLENTKTEKLNKKPKENECHWPTKTITKNPKGLECNCPPMFGWIFPLQFWGNLLKLSETCNKDYLHMAYANKSSKESRCIHSNQFESSSFNNEKTVLEQCSSELKAVIKDICDSLSMFDENTEDLKLVSNKRKRPVWETKTEKEIQYKHFVPDIIDDGIHPLLQELPEVDLEDKELQSVQELLGKAFSPPESNPSEEILPVQSVCNPPCSVWCNEVPSQAKDAYKRFIRKMEFDSTVHHKITADKKNVLRKPLYKRSFSDGDTLKTYDKIPLLPASSLETRERLLFLKKVPSSFIDINNTSRSKSSDVSEQGDLNENSSDKWSLYDAADSKWKPLPDCVLLSDAAHKQSHRKARDMRRQKSVC